MWLVDGLPAASFRDLSPISRATLRECGGDPRRGRNVLVVVLGTVEPCPIGVTEALCHSDGLRARAREQLAPAIHEVYALARDLLLLRVTTCQCVKPVPPGWSWGRATSHLARMDGSRQACLNQTIGLRSKRAKIRTCLARASDSP